MTRSLPGYELSANISTLFREAPFLDRMELARESGFGAVECWWPFSSASPERGDVSAFLRAIDNSGVALSAMNLYAGDMSAGARGVVSRPGEQQPFADSLAVVEEIASSTGCRTFNALYGQRKEGVKAETHASVATANLGMACSRLGNFGGTVLLEPLARGLNGDYLLETAADALHVIDDVQAAYPGSRIALLLDSFHLTQNGEDLSAVIMENTARIGHVQIADSPGRDAPGTGSIDFASLISTLTQAGYAGYIGVEYIPLGPTTGSFGWIDDLADALSNPETRDDPRPRTTERTDALK